MEYHLGARGLRSIMESIMTDLMFELPTLKKGSTFTLTRDEAESKLQNKG
jgi:ATP-dependent Clp protease ATP-binding subunit ClpX